MTYQTKQAAGWLYLFILLAVLTALAGCGGAEEAATPTLAGEAEVPTTAAQEPEVTEAATEAPAEAPTEAATEVPVEAATEVPVETAAAPATPTAVPTTEGPAEAATPPTESVPVDTIGLELVAEGFTAPIALRPAPDESGRLFVVEQTGRIRIVTAEGEVLEQPFLDIGDRLVAINENYDERGLLGLAFHPEFAENGRFFVFYSAPLRQGAPAGWDNTIHVSQFTVSAEDADRADSDSEEILLQVDEPQSNHEGGQITFGPDGYLYIPLGDGGGADDVGMGHEEDWYDVNGGGNGQNTDNLLGSILRIDVDGEGTDGRAYAIPRDNPFVGGGGAPEIWAYGFRNPFHISFDTGGEQALFASDAGQNLWEEVNLVTAGGNYGWNVREGSHCFSTQQPDVPLETCPELDPNGAPLLPPIIEFPNSNQEGGLGLVVVGGVVYRGRALPELDGQYIFGQWSISFNQGSGSLFAAVPPAAAGEMWTMRPLIVAGRGSADLGAYLLSFGQDNEGEVYVLTSDTAGPSGQGGRVYRIVPAETAGN